MKTNQKGSAFIIVIVVIVVFTIGALIYSSGKSESTNNLGITNETTSEIDFMSPVSDVSTVVDKTGIGIVVTSVKTNDIVKLPVTIEGYLDGNGWYANEGEIGVVEVFDANGKSISNKEVIKTTTDWLKFPTYFKALVGDRQMMSYIQTDTGVIRITSNGAKDGEQIKSISISVRFK